MQSTGSPSNSTRSRAWFGTLNNWTETNYQGLLRFFREQCVWGICGKEVGEQGTPHLQWACTFKHPQAFSRMLKQLAAYECESHIEPTKSNEAVKKYCKKEGDWVEIGTQPVGAGKRTDIERVNEILETIDGEQDLFDLIDGENTMLILKHYKVLREYRSYVMRKSAPNNKPNFEVTLCVGPPGSGKSRWISQEYPDAFWVTYGDYGCQTWFDGYSGQKTLVLDDYKGNLPYSRLLRMCDRYKQELQVKGSSMPAVYNRVVISSIREPEEWYDYSTGCKNVAEVNRRITRRINFPINNLERRLTGVPLAPRKKKKSTM